MWQAWRMPYVHCQRGLPACHRWEPALGCLSLWGIGGLEWAWWGGGEGKDWFPPNPNPFSWMYFFQIINGIATHQTLTVSLCSQLSLEHYGTVQNMCACLQGSGYLHFVKWLGPGAMSAQPGHQPQTKINHVFKKIGHWMIALEIIHFYLNVLISKSVIILTLASQGHIFLSPVPCMHGGWSLWATSELFSKTTCMQPTPLSACGSSFLISLLSVVSSAHPKPPHLTASRVHILEVAFVPTCWKHCHHRKELWSMERPCNLYVWFRGGSKHPPVHV